MAIDVMSALRYANVVILNADYKLYQHCLNVAGIAQCSAKELDLDDELCFVAGLLHDCGKIVWLSEPRCYDFMEHAELSYGLLKDVDLDVATIAYMHHSYQTNKYPSVCEIEVPEHLEPYCELISFIDKVEANMTRSHATATEAINTMKKLYPFKPEIVTAVSQVVHKRSKYPVT
jgi:putative nucleotidyltransferase with HDIG domain